MGNYKCDTRTEGKLRVYLMASRSKDNQDVEGFVPRRRSFLSYEDHDYIARKFCEFVLGGIPGEMCRLYESVNARDEEKVKKALLIKLISDDNVHIGRIQSICVGVAAGKECADEKKWMIDFDSLDEKMLAEVEEYIVRQLITDSKRSKKGEIAEEAARCLVRHHRTPNGYAIIVPWGFDSREFMEKYRDVCTIKKDDLLCVRWEKSGKGEGKS